MTRSEFRYESFQRVIPLPGRIHHQNITAEYKEGIRQLSLSKEEKEKNKAVKGNIG